MKTKGNNRDKRGSFTNKPVEWSQLHAHPAGHMERWIEYFDELLNNQNIGQLEVPPTEDDGQIISLKILSRLEPMELV